MPGEQQQKCSHGKDLAARFGFWLAGPLPPSGKQLIAHSLNSIYYFALNSNYRFAVQFSLVYGQSAFCQAQKFLKLKIFFRRVEKTSV